MLIPCKWSYGQDIQIRMETRSYFDAPYVGRVDLYQTTFLAKKQKNIQNTSSIQKKFFGFIANLISDISDTTGHLITVTGEKWEYNSNKKNIGGHRRWLKKTRMMIKTQKKLVLL